MTTTRLTIPPRARRCDAGFTLMEILIALAIFGAGLVMAACLFPAGVSEHQKAVDYTVGTLLCNNGVALARAQLQHDSTTGVPKDPQGLLVANKLLNYPSDNTAAIYQFKIACVGVGGSDGGSPAAYYNNYQITVTPYKGGSVLSSTTPLIVKTPLNP